MKKISEILTVFCFVALIFTVPLIAKFEEKQNFLFYENRNVNNIEKLTKESFLNGSFFESIENYFIDIFPFRENILAFQTYLDKSILKKPVVNDIVFEDDLLLAKLNYAPVNDNEIKNNAQKMADSLKYLSDVTKENGGELYFVGLPEQYSYFRNKYPDYVFNNKDKLEKIENYFFQALEKNNVKNIDMNKEFDKIGRLDDFYSSLDHHYSYIGAFETYRTIIDKINQDSGLNIKKLEYDDIEFKELPNPYIGSRNRKLMGVYKFNEKLIIGSLKQPIEFKRFDNGKEVNSSLFSYPQDPSFPITYLVYMGGDIGETIIKTNRNDLPNILIIGDSFTNPIETLIYTGFNEMRSLDYRHYNQKTMSEYIKEYKPNFVFMIRDDTSYFTFTGNGDIK